MFDPFPLVTREEVLSALGSVPALGPLSRESLGVFVMVDPEGVYHSFERCRPTMFWSPRRLKFDDVFERHHQECLGLEVMLDGQLRLDRIGRRGPVALSDIDGMRSGLMTRLDAARSYDGDSALEVFEFLSSPFSAPHDRSFDEDLIRLLSAWKLEFVDLYLDAASSMIKRAPSLDVTELVEHLFSDIPRMKLRGLTPADLVAPTLCHVKDGLPSDFFYRVGGVGGALSAFFSVNTAGDLFLAPRLVAEYMNVTPSERVVFDAPPPRDVIEAAAVLFAPDSDGPYSDLNTTLQAASAL